MKTDKERVSYGLQTGSIMQVIFPTKMVASSLLQHGLTKLLVISPLVTEVAIAV